jgi:uncharacterized lipoprotein YajG
MPSPKHLRLRLALLLCSSLVTGCAEHVRTLVRTPPAADLKAATEAKPIPTVDILTSAKAEADYNASVEGWGDRISAAGARICRWSVDVGAKLPFACPSAVDPNKP